MSEENNNQTVFMGNVEKGINEGILKLSDDKKE